MFYSGYANYAKTILFLNHVWVNAINQSIISPHALESVQYLISCQYYANISTTFSKS